MKRLGLLVATLLVVVSTLAPRPAAAINCFTLCGGALGQTCLAESMSCGTVCYGGKCTCGCYEPA